jgi:hypothetical protein
LGFVIDILAFIWYRDILGFIFDKFGQFFPKTSGHPASKLVTLRISTANQVPALENLLRPLLNLYKIKLHSLSLSVFQPNLLFVGKTKSFTLALGSILKRFVSTHLK